MCDESNLVAVFTDVDFFGCRFYRLPLLLVAVFTVAFFTCCPFFRCPFYRCRFYRCPFFHLPLSPTAPAAHSEDVRSPERQPRTSGSVRCAASIDLQLLPWNFVALYAISLNSPVREFFSREREIFFGTRENRVPLTSLTTYIICNCISTLTNKQITTATLIFR